ncbi:hypothetical protein GCM10025862_28750 [Arsenicicoccus piscis]|uniref:phosphoribosylaminoimidazolesuccinocarboxamide synthase n=1 Tax=Arsenicicoccus piscis TaxID=673954 RepID=A0ABQ6HTJ5_9MICO|nr:hypothetical protein GCM10025862_28750 [Arsenicicoccus piscis]
MSATEQTAAAELPGYQHVYSGKVRDLYAPLDPATGEARDDQVLLVATDRISAYDFVLDTPIPDKGAVLTQLSLWWFDQLADLLPNHVVSTDVPDAVRGRAVLCERLQMLPIECIGRAYLTGGGLDEYRETGAVCGVPLPPVSRTALGCRRRSSPPRRRPPSASTTSRCRPPRSMPPWAVPSPPGSPTSPDESSRGATRSPGARHHPRRHQGRVRAAR